jgi:thiosulfate dehydrogenase
MMKFLLGVVLGLVILPAVVWGYFRFGQPPVAVADAPLPFEKQIVKVPLHARIDREMPASAPVDPNPANLMAGAETYREQCAACHGLPQRNAAFAAHMYPRAPQLWVSHRTGVIGVNDDPVGETYWKIDNGIRLTGMPSFNKVLNQTQMWQVAVLLKNAGATLPNPVVQLLNQPVDFNPPVESQASAPGLQPSKHP